MRPVSRAELARIAGVSSAAITKASKGKLAPACVGDRIDLDHTATRGYLKSKGAKIPRVDRKPTSPEEPEPKPIPKPTKPRRPPKKSAKKARVEPTARRRSTQSSEVPIELTEDFERYADATLREIVEQYGTLRVFRDCADSLKKIEDIRGKRLDNDEAEGHLISREAVRTHIVGTMHAVFERMLRDAPKTLVARLAPMARSGETEQAQERVTRELLSSTLKPALDSTVRAVRKLGKS